MKLTPLNTDSKSTKDSLDNQLLQTNYAPDSLKSQISENYPSNSKNSTIKKVLAKIPGTEHFSRAAGYATGKLPKNLATHAAITLAGAATIISIACSNDTTPRPTYTPTPTIEVLVQTPIQAASLETLTSTPTTTPTARAVVEEIMPVQSPTSMATAIYSPTPTQSPGPTQEPTPTQTPASVPTQPVPTSTHTLTPTTAPTQTYTPTSTSTSSPTATETSVPTATYSPTATPTGSPTPTPVPTATDTPTASPTSSPTSSPTPTDTPVPTATSTESPTATAVPTETPTAVPTATPTPAATPTNTPVPTPSVNPALAGYSPLMIEAVSSYPAKLDFVSDGLTPQEKNVLDWANGRLFSNESFLASKYSPNNWPSDVKLASAQAIPLLMNAIDIQKKSDGKHVINWEVDSLDRILDELDVYKGVTVSRDGKGNYDTGDKILKNYVPIVHDPRHVHREMLKTFAYLAKADGEGILIRSFMENDADDFELLYKRDIPNYTVTDTSFGWRNLSFMSQIELPDGTHKSFPTQVYEIVGDAGSERETAEKWFDNFNAVMSHFVGGTEDFADIYRPYSQTPYTPEPGYVLSVGLAGSPSSTGTTVSALRALGLKAEQFLSPEKGRRTGGVEIDGVTCYHNGNWPLTAVDLPIKFFFSNLKTVEDPTLDEYCAIYD